MYPKAEILFPFPVARKLRNLRGEKWAELVDRVAHLPETDPDALAFILMMIRINNCLKCYSGSYKCMRGCEACSIQGVMQFKGEDEDLIALFEKTKEELEAYLEGEGPPPSGVLEITFQTSSQDNTEE